ncbi:pentatricopeptide repeat-containing protein At2g13600-like [Triticum dicoccoides]|uniref:pentatricopeptide repeat-containing protein At2g13600-like n=1 Tax=Triticum dicoccoides TaxID=85692 RepID=UPI00189083AA|nr:pentatricopeptide repeat-containing protein At2g13600-like [Triticum dicoccoides]
MRAAVRTKRPRRPPPAAATAQLASSSRPKLEKAQVPLTLPLKSFKLRLANGPPLAPTPKAFKSYAETCATLLRLCRATATSHAAPASSSSSSDRLPLALSLHAHTVRSGVAADRSVASHLLTTYAAFARAAERDRAFGDCVAADAACSFTYDFMVSEHVKAGDIASARRLFDGMPERSVVSYTTMVDALMKRGRVAEAVELYEQCSSGSVAFFTATISGFVRNELHHNALAVFRKMVSCRVRPNGITFVCMIKACVGAGEFGLAMSIVGLAIKSNFFESSIEVQNSLITLHLRMGDADAARKVFDEMDVKDVVSWTALLDVYSESGDLDGARRVLDAMPERNEVSWGTLIARHEQRGNAAEAVKLYSQMLADGCRPNISCFSSVLSACASLEDLRGGARIHARSLKMGSSTNVFVSSSLIDMYCKCNKCRDAQTIFDTLPQKNIVCWNSLVSGYSYNGKMVEAMYLFKKMPARNLASWNTIISGYAQNRQFVDALKSFNAMLASGQVPGEITFSSVLLACANLCSLVTGKMAHAKTIKLGIEESIFIGTALSDMYAKSGDLQSSKRMFYQMPERNDVTWTAMIQGLAENGFAEESIILFEDMMATGMKPNEHTFLALLFACSHGGLVEQAMHYFEKMQAWGISPKEKHYTCMVDVLARAGRLAEAEALLMKTPSKSEANSWAALLSACNTYRNEEIAERAAKRLHELEKDNTAGYVLLSNMYASCGRWKDAARIRVLMKGTTLKKDGGCSWVQVRGQYHAFFSWEAKHPLSMEINEILDLLMWESSLDFVSSVDYQCGQP